MELEHNTLFTVLIVIFLNGFVFSQDNEFETYYEKSGYLETPRYNETIAFSKKLAQLSHFISYQTFGMSPQGRDLPLLILGNTDLENGTDDGKAIMLIQACIHAGESDGKDAGLMLLRDVAIHGKNIDLLENVVILFVPIFNVDGHEQFGPYNRINQNGPINMGWRGTAQKLNLNRDYLKADTPEMQAMINLYQKWRPDFYIDCHVTDGADYIYPLTYGLQMNGNLSQNQSQWLRDVYLPFVDKKMLDSGNPIAPYMDFVQWHDPAKGIQSYMETPRYSGGYAAINNRPALLIETHMLKDYKTRVTATYEMLLNSITLVAEQSSKIINLNKKADEEVAGMSESNEHYVLTYKSFKSDSIFKYEGYEYSVEKSELSGGNWYKYSDTPATMEIDYYDWKPNLSIQVPQAYIIPVELDKVIKKLELHDVKMRDLVRDSLIEVESYRFSNVSWKSSSFEGRIMLDYEASPLTKRISFHKGSKIVDMNQRSAQLAMHLLEPNAPDALVRWGFMNSIFEQKEYAESYVIENIAREMLAENPDLRIEFEKFVKENEGNASNPYAIWNWFYQRTPYWDTNINQYPVGRIMKK